MKKIILTLAAFLLLLLPVSAAEADVVYDGKKVEVKAGAVDGINQTVSGLFPGQEAVIDVTFANNSSSKTAWYLSNEILKTLLEGSTENGGYTYEVSYIAPNGSLNPLYENGVVGSEGQEGLHPADESLKEYFYLDTLAPGASGVIRIVVGLDGESQPNAYQNKTGELALRFAVEDQTENVVRIVNTSAGHAKEAAYSSVLVGALAVSAFSFLYLLLSRKGGKANA